MKRSALLCIIAITITIVLPSIVYGAHDDAANSKPIPGKRQSAPVSFIENKGQIIDQNGNPRNDIQFKLSVQGVTMFIGNGELHYQWYQSNSKVKSQKSKDGFREDNLKRESPLEGDLGVETYRLDVELLNANKNAEIITEEKLDYFENYYLPQCPDGATSHSYKKITYKNIYPNIDWVLYITTNSAITNHKSQIINNLKYDFIVHEGGDSKKIQIRYNGATSLKLVDGSLIAATPFGSITENAPYTYFANDKKEIPSNFILSGNVLSYNVNSIPSSFVGGREEVSGSLVIDPYVYFQQYATYYGGDNVDNGYGLCNDRDQHIFLVGQTLSPNNIATSGAYQNAINGSMFYSDGFLVKFSSVGVRLWATYYGGTNNDMFKAVACDSADNLFVVGNTFSTSAIATAGTHQPTYGGTTGSAYFGDGMLIKFDNGSGQRVWGTYYGGSENELVNGIAIHRNDLYITGSTFSPNNIATAGTYKPIMDTGTLHGFVAKFNLAGMRQWGTYYGDSGAGFIPYGIDIYDTNNVYFAGTIGVAFNDIAFLTKLSKTGALVWEKFIGGNTSCYALSIDRFGTIYIGGKTEAGTGIATTGTHKTTKSGLSDGFIISYNSLGTKVMGTYYGGDSIDIIQAIDASSKVLTTNYEGGIYVTGRTYSPTGIATAGSVQDSLYGISFSSWPDAFMANFTTAGLRAYATYYGGPSFEEGNAVLAPTNSTAVWIAGTTYSDSGIAKLNSNHQEYYGSAGQSSLNRGDAFLAEYEQVYYPPPQPGGPTMVVIKLPYNDTLFCQGDSFNLAYSVFTSFRPGNKFEAWICTPPAPFGIPTLHVKIGSINSTVAGTIPCKIPESLKGDSLYSICIKCDSPVAYPGSQFPLYSPTVPSRLHVKKLPAYPVATNNSPVCEGDTLRLYATDTSLVGYDWKGPNNYATSAQNPFMYNVKPTASGDYIVRASYNGCGRSDTTTVVVNPAPHLQDATSNSPICIGDTLHLHAADTVNGVTYSWTGPTFTSNAQNPNISNVNKTNAGLYKVVATLGNCTAEDTTRVLVGTRPSIDASGNGPLCAGDTLILHVTDTVSFNKYDWDGPDNFDGNVKDIVFPGVTTSMSGLYSVKVGLDNCYTTDTVTVIVNPIPDIEAGNNGPIWTGQQLQLYSTSLLPGVTYSWTGPNGFKSGDQTPYINSVTAAATGTYIVTAEAKGCSASDITIVTIRKPLSDSMMVLFPNPSTGKLTLIGTTIFDQAIPIEFITVDGKTVYITEAVSQNNIVYAEITLPGSLANGVYMMRMRLDGKTRTLRFVLGK